MEVYQCRRCRKVAPVGTAGFRDTPEGTLCLRCHSARRLREQEAGDSRAARGWSETRYVRISEEQARATGLPVGYEVVLSPQQRRCVGLVGEGHANIRIAAMLKITKRTVDFHLAHAYARLGAANRVQAANIARALKLI
jgi:DNA-binding CsgD family transcriptional regulator